MGNKYKETFRLKIGGSDCYTDKQVRNMRDYRGDKQIEDVLIKAITNKASQSQVVDTSILILIALKLGYTDLYVTKHYEEDHQTGQAKLLDTPPEYKLESPKKM